MEKKSLELVSDVTYHKGIEYYVDKKVNNVHQISDDEYEAEVTGESTYRVVLNIKDFSLSTCTCPFYKDGNKICKHIIAVHVSLHADVYKDEIEEYQSLKPPVKPKRIRKMKPKPVPEQPVVKEVVEDKGRKKHVPIEPVSKDLLVEDVFEDQPIKYRPYYVGHRLGDLRREKKMSRQQLAEEMGVERQTVEMWEAGKDLPSFDDLEYMAYILFGSSIEYLLFGQEDYFERHEPVEVIETDDDDEEDDITDVPEEFLLKDGEEETPYVDPFKEPKPVVTKSEPPKTPPGLIVGKAIIIFLKVLIAIAYTPFWFMVGMFTLFALLRAPWNLFRKMPEYPEEHNWDPNYTDIEFYDMVDDD